MITSYTDFLTKRNNIAGALLYCFGNSPFKTQAVFDEFRLVIDDLLSTTTMLPIYNSSLNNLHDLNKIYDNLIDSNMDILNPVRSYILDLVINPLQTRFGVSEQDVRNLIDAMILPEYSTLTEIFINYPEDVFTSIQTMNAPSRLLQYDILRVKYSENIELINYIDNELQPLLSAVIIPPRYTDEMFGFLSPSCSLFESARDKIDGDLRSIISDILATVGYTTDIENSLSFHELVINAMNISSWLDIERSFIPASIVTFTANSHKVAVQKYYMQLEESATIETASDSVAVAERINFDVNISNLQTLNDSQLQMNNELLQQVNSLKISITPVSKSEKFDKLRTSLLLKTFKISTFNSFNSMYSPNINGLSNANDNLESLLYSSFLKDKGGV